MRLCKDCWYYYPHRIVCCNREITEINPIDGSCIGNAITIYNTKCKGVDWRSIKYSPNKTYEFMIECKYCSIIHPYKHLEFYKQEMIKCKSCKRTSITLP